MSEKLTKEELIEYLENWAHLFNYHGATGESLAPLWERIEADREAIREEVLQTHFTLKETIEFKNHRNDSWIKGRLVIRENESSMTFWSDPIFVRRPAKKRPMKTAELIESIKSSSGRDLDWNLFQENLRSLCNAMGIPTETDQP